MRLPDPMQNVFRTAVGDEKQVAAWHPAFSSATVLYFFMNDVTVMCLKGTQVVFRSREEPFGKSGSSEQFSGKMYPVQDNLFRLSRFFAALIPRGVIRFGA